MLKGTIDEPEEEKVKIEAAVDDKIQNGDMFLGHCSQINFADQNSPNSTFQITKGKRVFGQKIALKLFNKASL